MDKVGDLVQPENQAMEEVKEQSSRVDQSGYLSTKGSNNQRKDCSEWNGVLCTNHQGGHMILFNLQGLQFQGGVSLNEAAQMSPEPKQDKVGGNQRKQLEAPAPSNPPTQLALPSAVAPLKKRKLTFEAHRTLETEQHPVKRGRSCNEEEPEDHHPQLLDSSENIGGFRQDSMTLTSQSYNKMLLPILLLQQMAQLQQRLKVAQEEAQAYKNEADHLKLLETSSRINVGTPSHNNVKQEGFLDGILNGQTEMLTATGVSALPPATAEITGKELQVNAEKSSAGDEATNAEINGDS